MKYPIIKKKQSVYPKRGSCPVCKKKKVFEPHSFITLTGGAMLMDKIGRNGGPDLKVQGFLDIIGHGAEGRSDSYYIVLNIAQDIKGGQFEFYFCSTKCLRKWFTQILNDIDKRITRQKTKVR